MFTERHCLYCNGVIDLNWARANRIYCTDSCRDSFYYQKYKKTWYKNRYQQQRKRWERSPNGKRAGIPIRDWIKMPKDWQ